MPLRITNTSSEIERLLQTRVYELQGFSANLRSQDVFAREVKQVLPLVAALDGETLACDYRRRFSTLMKEYQHLQMPVRLRDDADRAYLARVQQFSHDLLAYVETKHPILVDFILPAAARFQW